VKREAVKPWKKPWRREAWRREKVKGAVEQQSRRAVEQQSSRAAENPIN